jgi:hypothetical protein|tara:strand:+ start:918 stop:1232 length:315 start_codon:yes stop_codon:yes gene_type:complete
MLKVSNGVARDILKATNGQFFSVTFRKRSDNTLRKIHGRTGVRKGVTGDGMKYTPAKHDLVTIWDSGQLANSKGERTQGHKSIPLNDITELKVGGATLRVSPNA